MKLFFAFCALLYNGVLPAQAPTSAALTGFPFTSESLRYSVNWPSGLGLGEARMRAGKGAAGWEFEFTVDAGIPGYSVSDRYRSTSSLDLCSQEFERDTTHGSRQASERMTFEYKNGHARRVTKNGGKSELSISSCAHDVLAYIFYARRELGQGRVPPQENVLLGAPYSVRLEYTGEQTITVGDKKALTDRLVAYVKGPASDVSFEIFYARDPARTPLLVRVPLAPGTFSLELVR